MTFTERPASVEKALEEAILVEFAAGPWRVVVLAYALGQFRLQVWRWHPLASYPDLIGAQY